jgi:hypothetical protein
MAPAAGYISRTHRNDAARRAAQGLWRLIAGEQAAIGCAEDAAPRLGGGAGGGGDAAAAAAAAAAIAAGVGDAPRCRC